MAKNTTVNQRKKRRRRCHLINHPKLRVSRRSRKNQAVEKKKAAKTKLPQRNLKKSQHSKSKTIRRSNRNQVVRRKRVVKKINHLRSQMEQIHLLLLISLSLRRKLHLLLKSQVKKKNPNLKKLLHQKSR